MKLIIAAGPAVLVWAMAVSGQPTVVRAAEPRVDVTAGEQLFKQRCVSCHAVAGQGGKLGPDLGGIVGRKAGATAYAYSPALKASKTVWTATTLDAYLSAPAKAAPGTKMLISVSNPDQRKAVIAYLATKK